MSTVTLSCYKNHFKWEHGYINAHHTATEFINLLDSLAFTQHATVPTHQHGNILDLLISRGLHVGNVTVFDPDAT